MQLHLPQVQQPERARNRSARRARDLITLSD
jgi:hypothetical protein